MFLKKKKQTSQVYDELIEYLKGTIPEIENNINGELMEKFEDKIEDAKKGKHCEGGSYAVRFCRGLTLGSIIATIVNHDNPAHLFTTGVLGAITLYNYYKYNKAVLDQVIIEKKDYIDFLKAMSEAENGAGYQVIEEYINSRINSIGKKTAERENEMHDNDNQMQMGK